MKFFENRNESERINIFSANIKKSGEWYTLHKNCEVKNMKKLFSLMLLLGMMSGTFSLEAKTVAKKSTKTVKAGTKTVKKTKTAVSKEMAAENVKADPVAEFCEKMGGKSILKDVNGNPAGFCKLKDGKEVDELQYYLENNGNPMSKAPEQKMIGMANPASVYCEEQGGKSVSRKDKDGNEYGVCQMKDGKEVDEWEYYRQNNQMDTKGTPGKK